MNVKSKSKLKMISSLITCTLSLFSLVTLTLSWFAMNKDADAGGMGVLIKDTSLVKSVEYYVADSDADGYVFKPAATQAGNVMGKYDILADKYQFLIKVTLHSQMNVKVAGSTQTDFFLGSATATNGLQLTQTGYKEDGTTINNALSSVVAISAFVSADTTVDIAKSADAAGNTTYTIAQLPQNQVGFFNGNAGPAADIAASLNKTPVITDSLSVVADNNENGGYVFFMMLTYDSNLMSAVFDANMENPVFTEGTADSAIPFLLDFELLLSAAG